MAYFPNNPNGQATGANSSPVVWASDTALPAGTNNIGDVDILGGNVAHDVADSGNPIKIGGKAVASTATATMVANADRSDIITDLDGAQIIRLGVPLGDIKHERVTDTAGTSVASSVFGAVASTRNCITAISILRTDVATTSAYIDFRDGTGGSVLWSMALPAGGGAICTSSIPLFRTTANTALAYDVSTALTTVIISVSGFQSKV